MNVVVGCLPFHNYTIPSNDSISHHPCVPTNSALCGWLMSMTIRCVLVHCKWMERKLSKNHQRSLLIFGKGTIIINDYLFSKLLIHSSRLELLPGFLPACCQACPITSKYPTTSRLQVITVKEGLAESFMCIYINGYRTLLASSPHWQFGHSYSPLPHEDCIPSKQHNRTSTPGGKHAHTHTIRGSKRTYGPTKPPNEPITNHAMKMHDESTTTEVTDNRSISISMPIHQDRHEIWALKKIMAVSVSSNENELPLSSWVFSFSGAKKRKYNHVCSLMSFKQSITLVRFATDHPLMVTIFTVWLQ